MKPTKELRSQYEKFFRGYDIRGIYPAEVNEELAQLIGRIFSRIHKKVVVGYDTRNGSKDMANSFIHSAVKSGCTVIETGETPNPVCFYNAYKRKCSAVFITASHNPQQYNGIKIMNEKGVTDTKALQYLREHLGEKEEGHGKLVKDIYATEKYRQFICTTFKNINAKIAVDCMNGTAGIIIREILKCTGVKAEILYEEPKRNFGGRTPEPAMSSVHELSDLVVRKKCDFGVAFDGDVDRCLFVDNRGQPLRGDIAGVLIAKELFKNNKTATPINTSMLSKKLRHVEFLPIGRPYLEEALNKKRAQFAFERTSHYYFAKQYPFSDGILAMLYMAKIMGKRKLHMMRLKLKRYHDFEENYYFNTTENAVQLFEKIKEEYLKKHKKPLLIDGVKILKKEAWILIRPSNTEPIIRVTAEAETQTRLNELIKEFDEIRRKVQ